MTGGGSTRSSDAGGLLISPRPASRPLRIGVVGGGITGLAAAHRAIELGDRLPHGVNVTLLDAGPRLGGIAETLHVDEFLVETGADSFITSKPWAVDLCRRLGLEQCLIPTNERHRRSLVLCRGRVVPVPEGFVLLAPTRIRPVLRSSILSLRGRLRLLGELIVPAGEPRHDESLADFVRRRFGSETLERLVQPLVGGIYTSDPEKLSLQATLPRFPELEQRYGSVIRGTLKTDRSITEISGARYGQFVTLRDGISELLGQLQRRLESAAEIQLDTRVDRLVCRSQGQLPEWTTIDHRDRVRDFDRVILCLPAFRAANLVRELSAETADLLAGIEYASSAIIVTAHDEVDVAHALDAFGLVVPEIEGRRVLAVSFASRKFPGRAPDGAVLLRTFVGGAMHPEVLEDDDEHLTQLARDELSSLLGVTGEPRLARVFRCERAMPQYHVGHQDRVARIEQWVGSLRGIELAGNAYRGVGLPDCIHSGESAAERSVGLGRADG